MGIPKRLICILENISIRSVHRYIRRWIETKTILSKAESSGFETGRPATVSADDLIQMLDLLHQDPTLYIDEMADELSALRGRQITAAIIKYWLKKLGMTRKKLWRVCIVFLFQKVSIFLFQNV